MSRYGNIQNVMHLDFEDGAELIRKAYEKTAEDKAWQMYLTKYQNMTEKSYMPFEDFYNPRNEHIENRNESAEEILDEVKAMMNSCEWRSDSNGII
ncbi:hypothetical protein [Sporosarcina sp. OR05]|uniref:hypothetical protein n=1 Tax=Sporosarcina sp. OR05 TaxID=2969819 RepID=UPI00352A4536